MTRPIPWSLIVLACLCGVLMMQGCAAAPTNSAVDAGPIYGSQGLRSMAFDSPAQRELLQARPIHDLPWYASRQDRGPSVTVGYQSPRFESAVVNTYDRQGQSSGRVYDTYRRNTYSSTTRQVIQR